MNHLKDSTKLCIIMSAIINLESTKFQTAAFLFVGMHINLKKIYN